MGTGIDQEEFDERDYARFAERLEQCLSTLGQLLERPGFGAGPATIGAELELFVVDGAARPLPHNQAIRAAVADPRVTVELDRFNLELNASPVQLADRPFAALGGELNVLLDQVASAAKDHAGRPAMIGILPTLRVADLGPDMITDTPRYQALNSGLRRLRRDPFRIRIAGADPLELASADVGLEGANSSFQILWVPTILSLPLTWCLLLDQGRASSPSGCARATHSGTFSTRVTTIRISRGAPGIRLARLARLVRPRQGRRDPDPAAPGGRAPAPGQNPEAVLG